MEKENVVAEQYQELSKEEILARSRKENNQTGDERQQQLRNKGLFIATMVGLAFLVVIYIVNFLVYKINSYELCAVIFSVEGVNGILAYKFGTKKRKLCLALGIISLLCSAGMLVLWILRLCGF